MKKLFPLTLALMLTLTACSSNEEEAKSEAFATITDHANNVLVLEKEATKVVTSYYITTSAVLGVGAVDKLVALEDNAGYRPLYEHVAPHLLGIPGVGTAKDVDIEATLALEPDLVILPTRVQDSANTLTELGVNVLSVNPESSKELKEMIRMIGKATGNDEQAEKVIERAETSLSTLDKKLENAKAPTVYLASNSGILVTAGAKMYQDTLIEQAKAINVAKSIEDTYWAAISYEQLIDYNPEYIIITPAANYGVEEVLNNPNIQMLDCIKNKKVYKMPSSLEAWDSPLPSSFLGSLWIASVVHPEFYTNEEFVLAVQSFYKDFYGFNVEPSMIK